MKSPGIESKTFKVQFTYNWFRKGEILKINGCDETNFIVLKVYDDWWWRKLLRFLGFKTKLFEIKVKAIGNSYENDPRLK